MVGFRERGACSAWLPSPQEPFKCSAFAKKKSPAPEYSYIFRDGALYDKIPRYHPHLKSKAALISSHSLLCLTRIHVTAYFEACFGRPAPECSLLFYSLLTRLSAGDRIFLSDSLKQSLLHCLYMKFYGHHYIPFLKTCKALFEISRIFSIFFY